MDSIKKYWAELQSREKMVLGMGGIIVSIILVYALLLQPLYRAINHMETALPGIRSNLVWMRQTDALLNSGGNLPVKNNSEGSKDSLLSVIESTARKVGIRKAIQQMAPVKNNNEVRVVLEEADFNQWLRWVDTLYKRYDVDIRQVTAERDEDQPNVAEIRITFFRAK